MTRSTAWPSTDPAAASVAEATILLAGTGRYTAGLPEVPSVAGTLDDLRRVFVQRCGAAADSVHVRLDLETPMDLGDELAAVADAAEGPLVVYFVGHGLVSASGGLYLATARSDRRANRVEHTALPYATVRRYLLDSRARPLVVILDCCFSGKAIDGLDAPEDEVANLAGIEGAFVLTSAGRDEIALAPPGRPHTAFGGALIGLLDHGDPAGPERLTLDDAYRYLARVLPSAGCPRPRVRVTGTAGGLGLASNPAARVVRPARHQAARRGTGTASLVCPYRGLSAFEEGDAAWFFGRERLTAALTARLAERYDDPSPLVVTGVSGAGKSSLLRAGLLAGVGQGALRIPGSASWPHRVLTPTSDPLGALAALVASFSASGPAAAPDAGVAAGPADPEMSLAAGLDADRLRADPGVLSRALRDAAPDGGRVVLAVDQFEELFTHGVSEEDTAAFVAAVAGAASGDQPGALVVIGVRADFYGRCAAYPELKRALEHRPLVVDSMSTVELRAAIERPAAVSGLELEPGVVDLLLSDLGDEPGRAGLAGRLPLLSHALLATWQQRDGAALTVAGYRATGGIHGALAATADRVLAGLDPDTLATAQRVLRRLVHVGDGTDDTRYRVDRAQLVAGLPDPERVAAVLDAFSAPDARLVTVNESTVEITHEALLHAWPTLRSWIEADRAGLLVEQRLVDSARAWDADGREPAGLYRGSRLQLAKDWAADAADHAARLGPLPTEFLAASVRRDLVEQAAARRRARRRVVLTAVLAVLSLLATTASGFAVYQARAASTEARAATVNGMVSRSGALRDTDPATALRLGVAALSANPSAESHAGLVRLLVGSRYAGQLDTGAAAAGGMVLAGSRLLAVVAGGKDPSEVWDVADRARPRRVATMKHPEGRGWDTGETWTVTASRDGRLVLDGNSVWDITDPAKPRPLAALNRRDEDVEGPTWTVSYHDGRRLAAVGGGEDRLETRGMAALWDLTDPEHPVRAGELAGHDGPVWTVAFSPDGRTVVTGSNAKAATVWDVVDPAHPRRIAELPGHVGPVWTVAYGPDGRAVVTGTGAGTAILWDLRDRTRPVRVATLTGHIGNVGAAAFGPDGRALITAASQDSAAVVWDLSTLESPRRVGTLPTGTPVSTVAFAPDGRTMATAGDDGVLLWDAADPARPAAGPGAPAYTVAYDRTGTLAVVDDVDTLPALQLVALDGATPRRLSTMDGTGLVGLAADGSAAVTQTKGEFAIWDLADKERPRQAATLTGDRAALSPDGRLLSVAPKSNSDAVLWNIGDRDHPRRLGTIDIPEEGYAFGLTFSPDNRLLVDPGQYESVLWDISDPTQPRKSGTVAGTNVVFRPDGRYVIAGDETTAVAVWDVADPAHPVRLAGLAGGRATFSPDGRLAVTYARPHTLLWDLTYPGQPQRLTTFEGHEGYAFSHGGRVFQADSGDPPTVAYDLGAFAAIVADPVGYACRIVGEGLTRAEWSRYASGLPYRTTC